MTCAACDHTHSERAKFCPERGTPVAARCASCGGELLPAAKLCAECGTKVAALGEARRLCTEMDATGHLERLDREWGLS